ncbi:polysaccharide biosynthesis/export family protein [Negadavirga shengliensis]|uniref:Polysaccharide biosynthesis/export family protein n=1 Tax=Negadavirga shengliensis TaxID=1389218 RepID=A0ABV9T305_9BACT
MMKAHFIFFLVVWMSFGCAKRNLVYFSDVEGQSDYSVKVPEMIQPKIQKDDLLKITVSSLSPESNLLFNVGVLNAGTDARSSSNVQPLNEGYLVDQHGEINFPVLGRIRLEGMTKAEAVEAVTARLQEYVKDPIVNIRFVNFKITVVGEVNHPSTFTVPTEKINILEALGLAGDMTMYGKRENVLIIRERDGVRSAKRLNLNNKDLLASPYYYLQQNDVIYVEPDKIKAVQASTNQRSLTLFGIATSLAVSLMFNLRWFLARN